METDEVAETGSQKQGHRATRESVVSWDGNGDAIIFKLPEFDYLLTHVPHPLASDKTKSGGNRGRTPKAGKIESSRVAFGSLEHLKCASGVSEQGGVDEIDRPACVNNPPTRVGGEFLAPEQAHEIELHRLYFPADLPRLWNIAGR